jgi:sugar phosphate isomerase/epimerase
VAAGRRVESTIETEETVSAKQMNDEMKLGLVTYNLAKDWDVDSIIANCSETGFEGVELRTTHAHGVEVGLSAAERDRIKQTFADSPVRLEGLGSAFEYHATDPDEVRQNVEGTKEYAKLARDVGAPGIKVRPNGLQTKAGIPVEKTLEQIGTALRECAEFAASLGVEVRLEVHGRETNRVPHIQRILEFADAENLYVCWNSNPQDLEDGGVEANFARVGSRIRLVHMRDLYVDYPWQTLFRLLQKSGYTGYCLAEIPASDDPLRVMHYYRALFDAYRS